MVDWIDRAFNFISVTLDYMLYKRLPSTLPQQPLQSAQPPQQQPPPVQPPSQNQPNAFGIGPWDEAQFTRTFDLLHHAEQMNLAVHLNRNSGILDINGKKIRLVLAAIVDDAERLRTMRVLSNLQPDEFDAQVKARGMLAYDPNTVTLQDLQNMANDLMAHLPTTDQIRDGFNNNILPQMQGWNDRLAQARGVERFNPNDQNARDRENRRLKTKNIIVLVAVLLVIAFFVFQLVTLYLK